MKFAALLVVSTLAAAPALAQTTVPAQPAPPVMAPTQPPQPSPAAAKAAETALRQVIDEFRAGKLRTTLTMTDELRDRITPKADQVHNILTGLGDVKTVSVLGMDPDFRRDLLPRGVRQRRLRLGHPALRRRQAGGAGACVRSQTEG